MNLKEAFRFQNKIQVLMDEAMQILGMDKNVTKTTNTYLRSKVMPEAQDETIEEMASTDYAGQITEIASFLMFLLGEKEKLSKAIRTAKNALPIDIDAETSVNACRQSMARIFKRMSDLRGSELTYANGGYGYRFNSDGNQVSYKCDVKKVTVINFDRNVVRKYLTKLNQTADSTSAELDRCIVNAEVEYDIPFDVNDSFSDILERFAHKESA